MNKAVKIQKVYEEFINEYQQARSKAQRQLVEYADVISGALKELGKKKWLEWLADERVNLKKSQAYKFVALSKHCKNSVQLTGLLRDKQVEKAYLLTKIKDPEQQKELAEQVIDAEFTVVQTKQAISKMKNENKSPVEAVQEVRNQPEQVKEPKIKPERKTIPIEEFEELRIKYEKLLKEKQELEDRLNNQPESSIKSAIPKEEPALQEEILKEPVKSDQPENTVNKAKHSIVVKGWEIPVPEAIKIDEDNIEKAKFAAINNARVKHQLEL